MVLKAEDILRQIESAGYQVIGWRESIGDGQDGPLSVTAPRIRRDPAASCEPDNHCSVGRATDKRTGRVSRMKRHMVLIANGCKPLVEKPVFHFYQPPPQSDSRFSRIPGLELRTGAGCDETSNNYSKNVPFLLDSQGPDRVNSKEVYRTRPVSEEGELCISRRSRQGVEVFVGRPHLIPLLRASRCAGRAARKNRER